MTRLAGGRGPLPKRLRYDDEALYAVAAHATADLAERVGDPEAQASRLAAYCLPLSDRQAAKVAGFAVLIAHGMLAQLGGVTAPNAESPAPLPPLPFGFRTVVDTFTKETADV